MSEGIRDILEEIVRDNGQLVFDDEYMRCHSCGADALGAASASHDDDCIVKRAERLLVESK